MAQDYYETVDVKEYHSLARTVLVFCSMQYLQPRLQCRLALPLSRILPIKSNKRETWAERKYFTGLVYSEKWIQAFCSTHHR